MFALVMKTLSRNCAPEVTSKIKAPLHEARRPNCGRFSKSKGSWVVVGDGVPGTEDSGLEAIVTSGPLLPLSPLFGNVFSKIPMAVFDELKEVLR